jgi:hypothetical protein
MKIYKDDIIEALETEPLTFGTWQDTLGCRVCAVGAVLRNCGYGVDRDAMKNICAAVTEMQYFDDDLAPRGNWMSALSIVWEYLCRYNAAEPDELREDIVQWAEDNIPEDYVVEIEAPNAA